MMKQTINTKALSEKLKKAITRWAFWRPIIAIATGGILGFLYYHFVGCSSGSCPITSNPYTSIIVGGLFGLFVVSSPCSRGKC